MGLDWPKPNCIEKPESMSVGCLFCWEGGEWVGVFYLLDFERSLDLRYVLLDILLQGGDVNGLADLSRHCDCLPHGDRMRCMYGMTASSDRNK